ncbi:MAG TPA: YfjI family protein [Polyangiaceae bacterium]|nr:YfjI family protein [Polyangiaceae bacterium]
MKSAVRATPIDLEAPVAVSTDGWDEPAPFGALDAGSFPINALPSWARAWCEEEARALQVPVDLPAMLLLAVVSICISKKFVVRVKPGWHEPTNVYVVIALGVGEGKSPVFAHATAPLQQWEAEQRATLGPHIAAAEERRQLLEERRKCARQAAAKRRHTEAARSAEQDACALAIELRELSIPAIPRLIADDATPEAVGRLLAEHGGRLGVFSSEGGPLAILAGRYSEGRANLDLFCKAYSADSYTLDRVNRASLHVRAPHLTLALTVQPSVISGLRATPEMRGQGLLARFLYAIPKSCVGTRDPDPEPMCEATRDAYEAMIGKLLGLKAQLDARGEITPSFVEMTPEARQELIAFKARLEPRLGPAGDLRTIADWGNKLPGAVARLACVLHMAECTATHPADAASAIERSTVVLAVKLGEYLVDHARAAFQLMQADPQDDLAQRVLDWLLRHGEKQVTQRDIQRGVHARSVKELGVAIETLVERGYLRKVETLPTGGRPNSPTYDLNPRAKR